MLGLAGDRSVIRSTNGRSDGAFRIIEGVRAAVADLAEDLGDFGALKICRPDRFGRVAVAIAGPQVRDTRNGVRPRVLSPMMVLRYCGMGKPSIGQRR